jgi:dipeptidyl aminopeptidase/acylaminoacyl peptidase
MTTSHLTPRILVAVTLAAIVIGVPVTAQRVSESELLLREALHKQQVQGDLPGAIKIYQQIVSARNGDRSVTGRALLALAGCYEKLGQQAEAVYQRIIRDFGDQPVAVQARARLAALRPATPAPAVTLRKLETPPDVWDVLRTDGQRAVFLGGSVEDPTLLFGDLAGKEKRTVGPAPARASISPDLSAVVAYRLRTEQLSIMKTDGSGERVLELRENGKLLSLRGRVPLSMSWSWDNRYVLITSPDDAGSRLLRITVADGTVREVQPGLRGVEGGRFSPDGQFIAYWQAGVHVIPSGGGESQPIASKGLVDWTRDGRHVLIRDRTSDGLLLSAVPVQQGRRQGAPIPLRTVPHSGIQTMMNGSLFVRSGDRPADVRDTWLGILDDATASTTWTSLNLAGPPNPGTLTPWSPDGTRFAYVTGDVFQPTQMIRVKNIETGDDRELYRADFIGGCVAAHRQNVLFCVRGTPFEDRQIFSVSLESGRAETRGTLRRRGNIEQMTSDDENIVFYDRATNARFEWEIATGEQRVVSFYRSEDARWSLRGWRPIEIRPATDGTDWRPLVPRSFVPPGGYGVVRFSPDGEWVLYYDRDRDGQHGLYRVATEGGQPQRLGDYPPAGRTPVLNGSALSISRDGRRFIVHATRERRWTGDYWILENFLPVVPATSAAAAKTGK